MVERYNVIYADPGWAYRNERTGGSHKSGAAQKYKVMATTDLCCLPVKSFTEKNSVLFLWATVPMLPDAFQVMAVWGFTYKTAIFWHKIGRLGLGYWFRGEVEMLLFGVRGKVKAFRSNLPNYLELPVLKHSEKPEEFRRLIEAATARIEGRRMIELFARRRIPGWDAWGDEVKSDIDLKG